MSRDTLAQKLPDDPPVERGGHGESAAPKGALAKRLAAVIGLTVFSGVAVFAIGFGRKAQQGPVEKVIINQGAVFEPAAQAAELQVPISLAKPVVAIPATAPLIEVKKGPDMLDAARRAPLTAFAKTSVGGGQRVLGAAAGDGPDDKTAFGQMMKQTDLSGTRAGFLGNRDFIIAMGTSIPCVLETALSSDQPGFATCVTNRDILSDNGRVVLMEKGTQVVGEYRGGLKAGQSRLFVLWNRAKTPAGVIVTLGSPATDALGRAGFDGAIDVHWWERFGSALLLSIVADASTYGTQRLQQTAGVQANNTGNSANQAASIAVEQSGAIVPTLNKHQGELVNILVARDLDFSAVYRLRVLPPGQRSPAWNEAAVFPADSASPQPSLK